MRSLLQRARGAIGLAVTWAVACGAVGIVPRWVLGINTDAPIPLLFGVFGFIAGLTFSAILALTEGRRRFDQLSLPRIAGWGAVGGLLLSAVWAQAQSLGLGDMAAVTATFAIASAACASGSLVLARRAGRRELPNAEEERRLPST